jgi:hypothetical protein
MSSSAKPQSSSNIPDLRPTSLSAQPQRHANLNPQSANNDSHTTRPSGGVPVPSCCSVVCCLCPLKREVPFSFSPPLRCEPGLALCSCGSGSEHGSRCRWSAPRREIPSVQVHRATLHRPPDNGAAESIGDNVVTHSVRLC